MHVVNLNQRNYIFYNYLFGIAFKTHFSVIGIVEYDLKLKEFEFISFFAQILHILNVICLKNMFYYTNF